MAGEAQPRRHLLKVFLTVILALALTVLVASLVFRHQVTQERARVLDGVTPGMPFQQADAALRARGRAATDEEAREFAFEERPPLGRYAHYSSGILMIRVDQKDGLVRSIEAETVEFK